MNRRVSIPALSLMSAAWAVAGAAIALVGCASGEYRYLPNEHETAGSQRTDKAIYTEAGGSIRVSSMGVQDVQPAEGAKSMPALHINLAISNSRGKAAWIFDPRDQFVSFPNQAEVRPILVKTDKPTTPTITIAPGELRTVDLYFPMPQLNASAKDVPEFDYHWSVRAGTEVIAKTTLFDRIQLPEYPPYPYGPYPYAWGWGPGWWGGVAYPYRW